MPSSRSTLATSGEADDRRNDPEDEVRSRERRSVGLTWIGELPIARLRARAHGQAEGQPAHARRRTTIPSVSSAAGARLVGADGRADGTSRWRPVEEQVGHAGTGDERTGGQSSAAPERRSDVAHQLVSDGHRIAAEPLDVTARALRQSPTLRATIVAICALVC